MEKEIMHVIHLYSSYVSKCYVLLKYVITPFSEIDESLPKDGGIIDIGCGSGMYSFYLRFRSDKRTITGIDNDMKRIGKCRSVSASVGGTEFKVVDLNGDYSLGKYDGYLINDVLHHIPDESKQKLLGKIHSSMGKGSVLVIKDINDRIRPKFMVNLIIDKTMTRCQKLYFIGEQDMMRMIAEAGFTAERRVVGDYILPHVIYICRKR